MFDGGPIAKTRRLDFVLDKSSMAVLLEVV